jgi:hypothetical protein
VGKKDDSRGIGEEEGMRRSGGGGFSEEERVRKRGC